MAPSNRSKIYYDKVKDEHVLTMSKLAAADAGTYDCVAENSAGETRCRIPLLLEGGCLLLPQGLCRDRSEPQ